MPQGAAAPIIAGIGTGISAISTAAQLAQDSPKSGFNPINGGASQSPSPIMGSQRASSPLVSGNTQPNRYAAISELLNGGGSYA